MRICYLANARSIHTQRWAKHFSRKHDVTVISFEPAEIDGAKVYSLSIPRVLRRAGILVRFPQVSHLVHMLRPDIVHAHYVTSYGLAGALTGLHPFVVTAWGSDVLVMPEQSLLYRAMVHFVLRRADLITSMAEHMTQQLINQGYVCSEQLITLPFGVDTGIFHPGRRKILTGASPLVVSTRRLDTGMDVDTFVRAIPEVVACCGDARFIVAGGGALRKNMEFLATSLGVNDYVTFTGEICTDEMADLLGRADVFVSTSPSDGNNISLNEAMACGAFPIATDIPANRAWIESGKNGILYPCRDEHMLSDAILSALERRDKQLVMRENWDIVRAKASWDVHMSRMEKYYEALLEKGRVAQ